MRVAHGAKGINTNAFLDFSHPLDAHPPPMEIMQPFLRGVGGRHLSWAEELHVLNLSANFFFK